MLFWIFKASTDIFCQFLSPFSSERPKGKVSLGTNTYLLEAVAGGQNSVSINGLKTVFY